ncbi:MAG: ATP-dependent Clp protease adaptor ClpS [Nitrospiraceae bacterium]
MPAPSTPLAIPGTIEQISTRAGNETEARVIVHNCDCHTYQQVIQIFCATIPGMTPKKAFELAYQIDHEGQAVVFRGEWREAEAIAKKIADGGLKVEVQ